MANKEYGVTDILDILLRAQAGDSIRRIVADRLQIETGINEPLDAGMTQGVRTGSGNLDAGFVQVVGSPTRNRSPSKRNKGRHHPEKDVPICGLGPAVLQVIEDSLTHNPR